MYCVHCGKQIEDDSKFCPICGKEQFNDGKNEQVVNNGVGTEIPQFTPPNQSEDVGNRINNQKIPVFTPPKENKIPTFTPPKEERHSGPVCFHHPTEKAVAQCARCGKYICKDCAEAYGVVSGEYAGRHLCYDCCEAIVADNVEKLKKDRAKIIFHYVLTFIGMIFGLSVVVSEGGTGWALFFGAVVGGVFLSAAKLFFISLWEAIKLCFQGEEGIIAAIFLMIIQIFVILFKSTVQCITKLVQYTSYIIRTSGFIKSDSEALQNMRDYMEYTLVVNNNKGVDIETLMNEGSELYNNSYAQNLRENGEEAADAMLRQATTTIAENGEIIRNFAA